MLDKMLKGVLARMDATAAVVRAERAAIERERAGDTARDHAGRMLESPEGYSTTPSKAAANAQKEYARARREWEEKGAGALELLTTLVIARERRDEAQAWLREHNATRAHRLSTGIHPEVRDFFALMFEHGVEPRQLANVRPEMLAMVSDLLRWDGHDRNMTDTTNPVPLVFSIYASRLMMKPGAMSDKARSKPGVAVPPQHYPDPDYYMFGDIIRPNEGSGTGARPSGQPEAPSDTKAEPGNGRDDLPAAKEARPAAAQVGTSEIDDPPFADEFALPPFIDDADAAKLLFGAEQFVRSDYEWEDALKAATGYVQGDSAQIIARVEAAREHPGETPLRYFLAAAKRDGIDAGWAAYRAATVKRVALEFATKPQWRDVRAQLGLGW